MGIMFLQLDDSDCDPARVAAVYGRLAAAVEMPSPEGGPLEQSGEIARRVCAATGIGLVIFEVPSRHRWLLELLARSDCSAGSEGDEESRPRSPLAIRSRAGA